MKGGITLAIYIAIGITGAAFGQSKPSPSMAELFEGSAPALFRGIVTPNRVVMTRGHGGLVQSHQTLFEDLRGRGTAVEMRGPCYSACTMITAYLGKDKLCIAPGAFLAFHAARGFNSGLVLMDATREMYREQPAHIRAWIDRNGGWQKLPLDGFWTLYDHELWAMGYPRCAS